jgi:hypothetical protein
LPSEGDRANAGSYDEFRIFDVSDPANPVLRSGSRCCGPRTILIEACPCRRRKVRVGRQPWYMRAANVAGFTDPVNLDHPTH